MRKSFSDVAIYSYGSTEWPNRFSSAIEHFNLTTKRLTNCDVKLESKDCTSEIANELGSLKNPTIILILNQDSSMPNFYLDMIVQYFSINLLKAYRNALTEKYGLNIIADSKYLLEFLTKHDGKWTKMAKISEDFLCDVETWREHDVIGKIQKRTAVRKDADCRFCFDSQRMSAIANNQIYVCFA